MFRKYVLQHVKRINICLILIKILFIPLRCETKVNRLSQKRDREFTIFFNLEQEQEIKSYLKKRSNRYFSPMKKRKT